MGITQKQIDYMDILLNDVGLDTRAKRNDFISIRVGREIKFLDALTKIEASKIIKELRELKENFRNN